MFSAWGARGHVHTAPCLSWEHTPVPAPKPLSPRCALYWHSAVSLPPSPSLSFPLLSSCFGDRVLVCTGWPRTPHIAVASLELAIHLLQPFSKHWDCGYISPHHTSGFNNHFYYLLQRGSVKCRSLRKRNQDKSVKWSRFF